MINGLENIDNFIEYIIYNYKFGDLDLISSDGLLGNSVLTFGLFYEETENNTDTSTRFRFKTFNELNKNE